MSDVPYNLEQVLTVIAGRLGSKPYAIRGTASLYLQGIEMNVDDIDVLCDKEVALAFNDIFKEYLVDPVSYKESLKFKSYFGRFLIAGVGVEVMGEWQIKDTKDNWSNVFRGEEKKEIKLQNCTLFVTPVETELVMFAKMGRWTALTKIKKQIGTGTSLQRGLF